MSCHSDFVPDEPLIWSIIHAYFQEHQMNESKIQSFNQFVTDGLPTIIRNASPFVVKYQNEWHVFEFDRITMNKPIHTESDNTSHPLFPKEARLRGLNYAADVFLHLLYKVYVMPHTDAVPVEQVLREGKLISCQRYTNVKCMTFAVMLKSVLCHLTDAARDYGECIFDSGGYFVVNGGEKMLMYRERLAYNKIFLYTEKDASYTHYAEVRSEHYNQYRSTNTLYMELSKATKTEPSAFYISDIPLVVWLRALGSLAGPDGKRICVTDKQIYTRFRFMAGERWNETYAQLVHNCLTVNQGLTSPEAAVARIGRLAADKDPDAQQRNGLAYLRLKLLPHVGYEERDFPFKIFALIEIACKLMDFAQDSSLKTDKDSYFNKRIESAEDLLGTLARQLLVKYLNSIKINVLKRLEKKKSIPVPEIFNDNKVSKGIFDSLASGMWHASRDKVTQTGMFSWSRL